MSKFLLLLPVLLASCTSLPAPGSANDPLKNCSVGVQGGTTGGIGVDLATGAVTGDPNVTLEGTIKCGL